MHAGRYHLALFLAVALVWLYVAFCGAGTIWDGAAAIYTVVDTGKLVLPHGRITHGLFSLPLVWASSRSRNIPLLEAVYALSWALIPLAALAATFFLLRRRSAESRIVAALIILSIPLPGQIMMFAEVHHLAQLTPLLLILAFEPMTVARLAAFLALAAFCGLHHPAAFLLFLLLAAVLGWKFVRRRAGLLDKIASGAMAIALVLSGWRFLFGLNDYEKSERTLATTILHYSLGLHGSPEIYVLLMFIAATLLVFYHPRPGALPAVLSLAALVILWWASDPGELGARRHLAPLRISVRPDAVSVLSHGTCAGPPPMVRGTRGACHHCAHVLRLPDGSGHGLPPVAYEAANATGHSHYAPHRGILD